MVEQWESVIIGDILEFKNGLNKGKEYFGHGTPIVNYADVYKKRGLKAADIKGKVSLTRDEIQRYNVHKNDVFFTRTSETPEEVGLSSVLLEDVENCVFSGFILRGRPKNEMLVPEYCKYCFSTDMIRTAIISGCTYTTRALTNGTQLSIIEIPIPPKEEQIHIANVLSDIDSLIDNLDKLIEKKKNTKKGVMQELLTGSKRLQGFKGKWERKLLGEISTMFSGGTPDSKNDKYYGGKIPWVSISDISNTRKYISTTQSTLTQAGYDNSSAKMYPENTLLFAMYASIGKCCIAKKSVSSSQAILGIYDLKGCDIEFLYYLLTYRNREFIEMGQTGTQSNLSKKIVEEIEVELPTIQEQKCIANVLADMDKEIDYLEEKLLKYKNIKTGMMKELLEGNIRLINKED